MNVTCNCGFEETFDEVSQPPIIFCPYCGGKGLMFSEKSGGRRIDLARVKALRKANWMGPLDLPRPRYRETWEFCAGICRRCKRLVHGAVSAAWLNADVPELVGRRGSVHSIERRFLTRTGRFVPRPKMAAYCVER